MREIDHLRAESCRIEADIVNMDTDMLFERANDLIGRFLEGRFIAFGIETQVGLTEEKRQEAKEEGVNLVIKAIEQQFEVKSLRAKADRIERGEE
jgi:hypothetical protein